MADSHPSVHLIPDVLTEMQCRRVIGMGLSRELQAALSPGMKVDSEKRSSMVTFIYHEPAVDWLFDRLWETVKIYPHGENITTLNFVQFTEYKQEYGGHFGIHRDTDHFYHATNTTKLKRKVTLVIQLSDPFTYEGGELVLYPKKGQTITGQRNRGCGIMFPSRMPHEAKKVTVGTRYSLVAWFEGPK